MGRWRASSSRSPSRDAEGQLGCDPQVAGQRSGNRVDLVDHELRPVREEVDPGHAAEPMPGPRSARRPLARSFSSSEGICGRELALRSGHALPGHVLVAVVEDVGRPDGADGTLDGRQLRASARCAPPPGGRTCRVGTARGPPRSRGADWPAAGRARWRSPRPRRSRSTNRRSAA